MGVSQQEFHMWLVLHWAWKGRERKARTIPMPELVCRVRTELSTVSGLLLLPLLSPISQQNCHPIATALWDCVSGTNDTYSHTCSELCRDCPRCWGLLENSTLAMTLLLVWFLVPILVFLNSETVQKKLVNTFCSARTAKSKGLAQQMKSEYELLPYWLLNTLYSVCMSISVYTSCCMSYEKTSQLVSKGSVILVLLSIIILA